MVLIPFSNSEKQQEKFILYLYMPETSMPINITFTGIQALTSLQLSFSTETLPQRANKTTTRVLIKFCKEHGRMKIKLIFDLAFIVTTGKKVDQ